MLLSRLYLIPIGLVVGAYGTLVGAGGGFVLVPLLLFLYPDDLPSTITSISLAVVFFNALSGSLAYGRQKRIDYRSGLLFAIATIPGAVLGAVTTHLFSRTLFNGVFGVALAAIATGIFLFPRPVNREPRQNAKGRWTRSLVDADGISYFYSFNGWLGEAISLGVGYISSLLGIGGGIIHVPALVQVLNFPPHIATATSHFVLAIMAFAGTLVHIVNGQFTVGIRRTLFLAIGVVIGAQIGAKFSHRVRSTLLLRLLAAALGVVGIRLILLAFLPS